MRPRNLIAAIHPRLAVVLHDLGMVWLAWIATNWLRYSFEAEPPPLAWFTPEIGWSWLRKAWCCGGPVYTKAYGVSPACPILWNIVRAGILGAVAIAIALFLYNRLATVPRAVLVMYPAAARRVSRCAAAGLSLLEGQPLRSLRARAGQRVLVLGAGRAGEVLVRELLRENRYRPLGFLDDNAALRGAKVHGVPVLGALDQLPQLSREVAAEMLLIAMPSASNAQMQRVVEACEQVGHRIPYGAAPAGRGVRTHGVQRAQGSRD